MVGEKREIELRVDGVTGEADLHRVRTAVAELDPAASVHLDDSTGIIHIETSCETLEVTSRLGAVGMSVRAMTG